MKLIITILALLVGLIFPGSIFAAQEFTTDFATTYTIGRDGVATIYQEITLTNNLPDIYATEYELEVGSNRIRAITVGTDNGSAIPHETIESDTKTTIKVNFNDKIVGRGKKRVFIIQYQNLDASQKIGNVLEVTIPKVAKNDSMNSYKVSIRVPMEFGQPSIITPAEYSLEKDAAFTTIYFDNQVIKESGITAIYGEKQIFNLILKYNLENPTITPIVTQIALPPDTAYQRMFYESIDPKPQAVAVDADGNWIATFELEPKEQLTVTATVNALTYLKPTVPVPLPKDLSVYLQDQKYWQVNNPIIQELAGELDTPKEIYDYLTKNFNYNYGRLDSQNTQRLGALSAIKNPENVLCQEFTDAFVAIARAAGIPARAVTGFAYTENAKLRPVALIQDVLHAWPEYYDQDKKAFVPVDPTWGNTTGGIDYFTSLDFNHLVFAIQGSKSDSPLPVGYYKFKGQASKDVDINFGTNLPMEKINLQTTPNLSSGFGVKGSSLEILFQNDSNVALYNPPITLAAQGLSLESDINPKISQILPFTRYTLPVKYAVASGSIETPRITITTYGQSQTIDIPASPFAGAGLALPLALTLGVVLITGVAVKAWSLLVSRKR